MKKKNYDEASVIRCLSKKNDIKIDTMTKTIEVVKNTTELGNGSWGKIDYLHKVHGYVYCFVSHLTGKYLPKKTTSDETSGISGKAAKRENKLNMAAMAKSAMRKAKTK